MLLIQSSIFQFFSIQGSVKGLLLLVLNTPKRRRFHAVGIDGNDGMYPIAYAVAEAENKETWTWFLEN